MCMILIPVANFRMQATENKCVEYSFGEICGEDGIISHVFGGINAVNTILSFNEQNSPKEIIESDRSQAKEDYLDRKTKDIFSAYKKALTRKDGKNTILVEYGDYYNEK